MADVKWRQWNTVPQKGDLIDRAALKIDTWERLSDAVRDLDKAPAVDAVEVVRCKNCIHLETSSQFRHCRVWGAINGMGDEGFCNYGERKET